MTIKDFLEQGNPEKYDFKLETGNSIYSAIDNPIERFILYRSDECLGSKYFPEMDLYIEEDRSLLGLENTDCDRAPLTKEIYKEMWEEAISNKEASGVDGDHGDTMTSFLSLFNIFVEEKIETNSLREYRKKYYRSGNKIQPVTKIYCTHLYYRMPDFLEQCSKYEEVTKFANVVHTIGNFIPVPKWFNKARSHHDYWDLTLIKIREWYMAETKEDKKAILIQLLNENSETIKETSKWLSWCGNDCDGEEGWKSFISINYMEAFVDKNTYKPILFYDNHDWDDKIDSDRALHIFNKNAELIEKRGRQIIESLEKN